MAIDSERLNCMTVPKETQGEDFLKEVPFYDRAAIGYYLHSFYNGCENIFQSIARFFENDIGQQTWHSNLLKRMTLTIPGYRPAVIDRELYRLLDDFRAFRHKFCHSYTFELDWEKERLIAEKFLTTAILFRNQLVTNSQNF